MIALSVIRNRILSELLIASHHFATNPGGANYSRLESCMLAHQAAQNLDGAQEEHLVSLCADADPVTYGALAIAAYV